MRRGYARLLFCVLLSAAAAGCGQAAKKAAERAIEAETGGEVDLDAEGGTFTYTDPQTGETTTTQVTERAVTVRGAGGETTAMIGEGASVPADWPEDAPLPEGLNVTAALAEGDACTVSGELGGAPSDVYQRAKQALLASGWDEEQESVSGQTHALGLSKDGREVQLFVVDSGAGAALTMTASR